MWDTKAYNEWHSQFFSLVKHVRIGFSCGHTQTQSSTFAFYNVQHFYNSKRTVTIKMHIIDHYKATENTFRSAFKISLCRRHSSQNQSTLDHHLTSQCVHYSTKHNNDQTNKISQNSRQL